MFSDTITAISTANAMGAVSIIRISGDDAISIASKLIGKDLSDKPGYTIHYGTAKENNEPVDEVLISLFKAPKSYTGEDVVEVNCHGGLYITRKILSLIIGLGARMARPGEFTERAVLNGKMDLAQAEGVDDLIRAKDEVNARSAIHSLKGSVSKILMPLEDDLTQMISNIEVNIDYPEYEDVHVMTHEELLPKCNKWLEEIDKLIKTTEQSITIKEGIDTVILGRPNVGKSSLLNALLEEDKAIVTDVEGTTRDIVEGSVRLNDITLNLIDTAGVHDTDDRIEQMGIDRSLQALEKAQLAIVVLDSKKELSEDDKKLLELTKNHKRIVVYNKDDDNTIEDKLSISVKNMRLDPLLDEIKKVYEEELYAAQTDTLNNERQVGLARQARQSVNDAKNALENDTELDLVLIDLENAWHALREITGKSGKEDLLDEIFSRFCLGK